MNKPWALITGASRGLGEYLAKTFWDGGWNLALVARSHEGLVRLTSNLPKHIGQEFTLFSCDLGVTKEVSALVIDLHKQLPRLDALINNAAMHGPIGPLSQNNLELWSRALQVNLMSPVTLCHGLLDLLSASSGGSIINISGGGATAPRPNFSSYASAKAGLVRFSETLAQEVLPLNIRVNCIAPGAMKTSLLEEVLRSGQDVTGVNEFELAQKVFGNGGASMGRVADLALFLAGDAGKGITGKLISAVWDNWQEWPNHLDELSISDAYTLRRIAGRDRGFSWGDK